MTDSNNLTESTTVPIIPHTREDVNLLGSQRNIAENTPPGPEIMSIVSCHGKTAVATIIGGGLALYYLVLPKGNQFAGRTDGLACAARFLSFSVLPLLVSIVSVVKYRLKHSLDYNPSSAEYSTSDGLRLRAQYLQNTTEQFIVHAIASLSLSTIVSDSRLLVCLTISFLLGRVAFIIGYSAHPAKRAFGFILTFYPSLFAIVYVVSFTIFDTIKNSLN
ncbi:hypothetical protein H4219_006175 [Mycoemilia scoparia]|uniref:MAPEG family protein n=1 Tax=Mycoemilia scoparia TaxID=417184 RepID=A0A9W8DI93_9FUNG|nr:hypothetical protein H4219_006175 [Mycoemilia scoparia]